MPKLRDGHVQNPRQVRHTGGCRQSQSADRLIMPQQLAYVIVTPYSLYKSRTGGILSRLITRTGLDLVGLRMFAPSAELVKEYAETIVSAHDGSSCRSCCSHRPTLSRSRIASRFGYKQIHAGRGSESEAA